MDIRLFLISILAFVTCGLLGAQTNGGYIAGTLLDESGNPAEEVTITIENTSTERLHNATTDANGRFHFESVPVGEYEIVTDLGQTEPAIFAIRADRLVRIELQTTSGGASADKPTLQIVPVDSDTGQITTTFGSETIKLLPQPNYISPSGGLFGAYNQSLLSGAVVAANPIQQAHGPIVAGVPALSNNFHVDGVDNNNRALPGPLVYLSNEATSDFSLQQNADSPRFGHAAGGQLNSIISSGANEVHGAVYWYLQNRELNALEPRLDESNAGENPRFDQNRLGATVGFPIIRNNLFGLANFEYIPLRFQRSPLGQALVPTQAGLASLTGMPGVSAQNLDVLRRSGNGVSDPVESVLVNGTAIPLGFAPSNMLVENERYMGTGALDWTGTQNDRVSGRYVHNKIDSTLSGATLPAFATPSETTALLASVGYSRLFGSNIANNLRVSYNRLDQVVAPGDFQFGVLDVFPNVQIQGLGLALGPQAGPDDTMIHTFQLGDSLSISRGAHQFRVGVDGRRILSSFSGLSSFRGDFTFSTLERFLLDQSPDVVAQRSFGDPTLNGDQWLWLFYVQDTWKLTPHVNLELGLSSQYASIPEALRRQGLNGDLNESGLIEFNEPEVDNFNFAPRVGVAYSPNTTTVFRAGAGMEYDALSTGMLPYLLLSPTLNTVTMANPLGQQAGFFTGGGLPRPINGRARVNSFFGNQELPYVIHWNVGAQKALVGELTVEAKYLGNRGIRLPIWSRLNDISRVTATNSLPVFGERPSSQTLESLDVTLQSLRGAPSNEFSQAGFTNPITTLNQGGTSMYHALMVGLRHRFSRGLHLTASYTYSDAETDTFSSPLDFSLPDRERFDAPWDQEHRLVATGVLDLESVLEGTPGFMRAVVANFSLMGTYTYGSEQRIPIVSGIDTTLSGNALGSAAFFNAAGTSDRGTGVTPLVNRAGQTVAYLANDPEARFVQGGFGTVSRRVPMLPLDQTSNLDFAAVKRFGYREVAAFELRLDAYNIFNHRQFTGNLIRSIENPLLGNNGATALPAFLNPGSAQFGNLRGWLSSNPRTLQVALRVSF